MNLKKSLLLISGIVLSISLLSGCSSNSSSNEVSSTQKDKTESVKIEDNKVKEDDVKKDDVVSDDKNAVNSEVKQEEDIIEPTKQTSGGGAVTGRLEPSFTYDNTKKVVKFQLINNMKSEQTLSYLTTKEFEVKVLDSSNKEIFNSSEGKTFEDKVSLKTLKEKEELNYEIDISSAVSQPGKYTVKFLLGASDQPIEMQTSVEIK